MVKVLDRLLLFIYSLVIGVALLVFLTVLFGFVDYAYAENYLSNLYYEPVIAFPMIGLAIVFFLISARLFYIAVRRTSAGRMSIERSTEHGHVRLSLDSLQQLALKAAGHVQGLSHTRSRIRIVEAGLVIELRTAVDGESAIPDVTDRLQQSVKTYLQEVAGIDVAEVSVTITHVAHNQSPPMINTDSGMR